MKSIPLFPIVGCFGPNHFCDRQNELKRLLQYIEINQSAIITSIRRMGKTELIKHLFSPLDKENKRNITAETADEILNWNLGHTFYVQQLC